MAALEAIGCQAPPDFPSWGRGTAGPLAFAGLALLYLVPVWAFPYLPTQDGPSHLANVFILKEYGAPGTRYQDFFTLHWDPFPNWTSHLLLLGLLHVLPPLAAEKVLASLYVLGFAWSFRYFLGAFGRDALALAPAGLLFVYNDCFLFGFYNYCLSLALYWLGLGYCLRRRQDLGERDVVPLLLLLTAAYFTHLVGYLLLLASALVALLAAPPRRLPRTLWFAAAALPSLLLTLGYFWDSGALGGPGPSAARFWSCLPKLADLPTTAWDGLQSWNWVFFACYEGAVHLGALVVLFLAALAVAGAPAAPGPAAPRWVAALLAGALGLLFLLLPDALGAYGAVLRPRLLLLCPLLGLACLRLPPGPRLRGAFVVGQYLLLALNLALVLAYFQSANVTLREFVAGAGAAGEGRTLRAVKPPKTALWQPDYLDHAADYYCLGTGNIDLDNYEAEHWYFPVRFRTAGERNGPQGIVPPPTEAPDLMLYWDRAPPAGTARDYRPIYQRGRLTILARRGAGAVATGGPRNRLQ